MGAPRIHEKLLMLGIDISESTVGRYMMRIGRPRSQSWKTFLRNHAAEIAVIDLSVVRTISFKLLYGLVILGHARRRLLRIAVTSNPTAQLPHPSLQMRLRLTYQLVQKIGRTMLALDRLISRGWLAHVR